MTEHDENSNTPYNDDEFESFDVGKWLVYFWYNRYVFIKIEVLFLIIGVLCALLLPHKYMMEWHRILNRYHYPETYQIRTIKLYFPWDINKNTLIV